MSAPTADSYDFVVIGAGSAGSVLANRLSAHGHGVLVLEAGGSNRHPNVIIPAAFPKLFKTSRDWDFSTEPDATLAGRSLYVPRGKMLGGSSSINAMIYVRGRPSDYDGWAASGCAGWSYDDVLPVFKRSERNERICDEYHGSDGELIVTDLRTVNPLSVAFVESAIAWGMEPTTDFNGVRQRGVGYYQVTQRNGRRWGAAEAFLTPARRRPGVTVLTGAHVERVVIENGRAIGVDYRRGGTSHRAHCTGEVVVAAGAINSPKVLMLSGVGPADDLRSQGIEPVVDLPVGANLQDHPVAMCVYESRRPGSLADAESLRHLAHWLVRRAGKLSSNIAEVGAFHRSTGGDGEADLQWHFGPAYFVEHGFESYDGDAFSLGPTLIDPRSRGRVALRSADPHDPVRIEGNYLAEFEDVERLVTGLEVSREIAHMPGLSSFRGRELYPGPEATTREQLADFVRRRAELLYHPAGTCAMGPPGAAVVDPQLRVNGVEGLRVADASVMPKVVSGNTNAPTIMIAEKAAEMILGS